MVVLDEDRLEFKRQLIHLLNGSAISVAVWFFKPAIGLYVLVPLLIALMLLYFTPRLWPDLKVSNHLMHHFERREDIKNFPFKGAIMYGLGIIPPIVLLPVNYACAVILILSVGDAFSNLVGRRWGIHKVGHRSLEGSFGFLVTSWAVSGFLIDPLQAGLLAFVGTLIELFIPFDDNLTIPGGLSLVVLAMGFAPLAV
ncbi:MAG: hypothetical protein V1875_08190 [Candidatus Altiarchaeota archaeon]